MPVSGNEEPGVLSCPLVNVSAGIPLKKRKLLLVPPPSPPRQEAPSSPKETNGLKKMDESCSDLKREESSVKKIDESCSDMRKEESIVKKIDESCAEMEKGGASTKIDESCPDLKREESISDLMSPDQSCTDVKSFGESVPTVKIEGEHGSECMNIEESGSELIGKECALDLRNKHIINSDQRPFSTNARDNSAGKSGMNENHLLELKKKTFLDAILNLTCTNMNAFGFEPPEVSFIDNLECKKFLSTEAFSTPEDLLNKLGSPLVSEEGSSLIHGKSDLERKQKFLLTEEFASPKVLLNTVGSPLLSYEGEIHYEQALPVKKNEGSSPVHGKSDATPLSLSLSRGMPALEQKTTDAGLGKNSDDLSTNRLNWDLNAPMDYWDGFAGDAAVASYNNASCTITNPNNIRQFLDRTDLESTFNNKGKQPIESNKDMYKHSSCLIASIQGNHETEYSLRLTLGVPSQEIIDKGLSPEVASRKYVLDSSLLSAAMSTPNMDSPGSGIVKSEPVEDYSKKTSVQPTGCTGGFIYSCSFKREPIERPDKESASFSISIPEKLSEQASVKVEPVMEVGREFCQVDDVAPQHELLKVGCFQDVGSSSGLSALLSLQKSSPSRLTASSELSSSVSTSNQPECFSNTNEIQVGNCSPVQSATGVHKSVLNCKEVKVSGNEIVTWKPEAINSNNSEIFQLKISKNHHDLQVNGEGSVRDEEKINISVETMEEYEYYGSDCESDGNQDFANQLNTQGIFVREDDNFEDGEVREALAHPPAGDATAETVGTQCVKLVSSEANPSVCFDVDNHSNIKDTKLGNEDDKTVEDGKECVAVVSVETNEQLTIKDGSLLTFSSDRIAAIAANDKLLVDTCQRKPVDQSGRESIPNGKEKGIPCDEPTSSFIRTLESVGEATDENADATGMVDKLDSSLPKVDATFKRDLAQKESTSGGNKSRIINLPRTSVTSSFETKSFPVSSLSSKSGREREEIDLDRRRGFVRERIQEQPFRNSRIGYMRGTGRFSGRMDNPRFEWDSEREFSGKSSRDLYHVSRSKHSAAFNDMETKPSNYVIAPDGTALATSRGSKDIRELPSCSHRFSRRLSPGNRDGRPTRDMQMLHKISRNASPGSRNNSMHGTDSLGLRRVDKFTRVIHDDIIDSSYSRPHSEYEDVDGHFVRGSRNFSTVQRSFFPRVRSKSPAGSQAHSPGSWSPRRRSPDRFKGLPKIAPRRSAAFYGADRMSSPDHPCFPGESVARRRGSPSYVSRATNGTRGVDSGSDHGHPRPFNSRRSPSDRVFSRSSRRVDVVDPQFRQCDDDFFGRPPHSAGFREFNGEGSGDERSKSRERRPFTRSFRSSYNNDSDNLRFHVNDGPRSFRFFSDGDTEHTGRSIGEREFDERIKNRPAVAPRRLNY